MEPCNLTGDSSASRCYKERVSFPVMRGFSRWKRTAACLAS
ncbi:hypothetical protein HMPREF0762_01265 [Slackia exigua ATCC 700122]|uniref:Uncharacterized protein n=1 Tax=Slackia exigua (strain ATCC 700122 / DSM 15923 / CIP 105133 / JCM 11022 / KCTC 5966 / S-7) TaxID=649764 RepID=D0WH00_SLAES|nr:hypothetical protein HMPREF0762_01265 [Slackia exigua ATCC 700122]